MDDEESEDDDENEDDPDSYTYMGVTYTYGNGEFGMGYYADDESFTAGGSDDDGDDGWGSWGGMGFGDDDDGFGPDGFITRDGFNALLAGSDDTRLAQATPPGRMPTPITPRAGPSISGRGPFGLGRPPIPSSLGPAPSDLAIGPVGAPRPPSISPVGAGRTGALHEALRQNGIPTSQLPTRVLPNVDLRGNPQPGRIYEYTVPAPGGGTRTIQIRDDSAGHSYGPNNPQNRGPHFNDPAGRHYDYPPLAPPPPRG